MSRHSLHAKAVASGACAQRDDDRDPRHRLRCARIVLAPSGPRIVAPDCGATILPPDEQRSQGSLLEFSRKSASLDVGPQQRPFVTLPLVTALRPDRRFSTWPFLLLSMQLNTAGPPGASPTGLLLLPNPAALRLISSRSCSTHLLELVVYAGGAREPSLISVLVPRAEHGD